MAGITKTTNERQQRWADQPAVITNRHLLELREVIEQLTGRMDDLEREARIVREALRGNDDVGDQLAIALERIEERIDQVERILERGDGPDDGTGDGAAGRGAVLPPAPERPAPAAAIPARPLDRLIGEVDWAMGRLIEGTLVYLELGFEGERLGLVVDCAVQAAQARRAQLDADERAARRWLAATGAGSGEGR